jgi:beta-mannanase
VEPWPISFITPNTTSLLSDIVYGKYVNVIRTVAADIKKFNAPVIVRWGQEMEATARYPWACKQPSAYIPAFQHVSAGF